MVYEFSDLTLDLERRLVTRGGEPVKLTKLSFKVLEVLVQASPALVSHDDLIDRVWGENRVITPDNLSQRMKTLRQSLGDDPGEPKYIEGVRGEGYRLVPEVRVQSAQEGGSPSTGTLPRGLLAAAAVVLVVFLGWFAIDQMGTGESDPAVSSSESPTTEPAVTEPAPAPSIAVLPFANLSADENNQFFADGIHDDLLTRISNIRDIKVISRTSVMTYRGSDKKAGTIAEELGVSTILEGGVQRAGEQVRINLQLIDAETDAHLWAQTYTRELTATNVFMVQGEITEAVAGALQVALSADEKSQLEKQPTENLQALDAYFLGNQFYSQGTSEGYSRAIEAYKTAISIDSEFALAHSKQALALLQQIWHGGFPRETQLEVSRLLIDEAILLDPQSSEAFTALGTWYAHSGDVENAERAFEQAMALGPNNEIALVSYGTLIAWVRGEPGSAIELYRKASELDPQNISHRVELANVLRAVGQAKEGIRMMEGVIQSQPDSAAAYRVLASLYSEGEYRHDKGIKVMRRAFELDPKHPENSFMNAVMHWRLADYGNTARWMNHIANLVPDPEEAPVYRGWAFIAQRDFDSARREFSSSRSGSAFYWLGVIYLGNVDTAEGRPQDAIERYQDLAKIFDGNKSLVNCAYGIAAIKAYQTLGEQEKAKVLIDQLIAALEANPSVTYHDSAIHDASIYALGGQEETAISILEEWVDRAGATSLLQQDIRHGLGVLADDPRYQSIFQTVNDRLSEQKANLARWEASGEMLPLPKEVLGGG